MTVPDDRMGYRPEIDGLRAVAIVATVAFHVGIPGFRSGFVGVDIFFVISGFLITRMLLAELDRTGRVDFPAFYARRVRRLLPALLLVVLTVLALGFLLRLTPPEYERLARSGAATAAFVSNIYFWRTGRAYFGEFAEPNPLLNMWTLSVEEQFYAIWPLVLTGFVFAIRRLRLPLTISLAVLLAVGIAVSFGGLAYKGGIKSITAFYLTPTRGWEFALGAAAALIESRRLCRDELIKWLAPIGLLAVLGAVVAGKTESAGLWILPLADLGTAAFICGAARAPQAFAVRVLGAPPAVLLGKLSYSWYLWHWPLLALVRLDQANVRNLTRDLLVAGGALALAALTYRFVENPIRYGRPWPFARSWQAVVVGGAMSAIVAGLASVLYWQARVEVIGARPAGLALPVKARSHWPASCFLLPDGVPHPFVERCVVGVKSAPTRVLVWGDSQANQYLGTVDEHGRGRGYSAIGATMGGCTPLLSQRPLPARQQAQACRELNAVVADELPILARDGLKGIMLSGSGYGFPFIRVPLARGELELASPVPATLVQDWKQSLRETLGLAQRLHLRVLVMVSLPSTSFPPDSCLARHSADFCSYNRSSAEQARAGLTEAMRSVAAEFDHVRVWDPMDVYCDGNNCGPVHDGAIVYSDMGHLSVAASRLLVEELRPDLDWLIGDIGTSR